MQKSLSPIIDVFLGNDETDLASFRIKYLSISVSAFVIGESAQTFTGKPKPLYFQEWLQSKPEFHDRVYVLELFPAGNTAWEREIDSRNQLCNKVLELFPNCSYIFSDLDEIPSLSQVEKMSGLNGDFHFPTPTCYRRANWMTRDWNARWNRGVFTSRSDFDLPNAGRLVKLARIDSSEQGSHLSYLGFGIEQMRRKLESSPHEEFDLSEISSGKFLAFCDLYRIDHLGRISSEKFGLLRVLQRHELSSLQIQLLELFPEWFDFTLPKSSYFLRLRASALVSIVTSRNSKSLFAFAYICRNTLSPKFRILLEYECLKLIIVSFIKKVARSVLRSMGYR